MRDESELRTAVDTLEAGRETTVDTGSIYRIGAPVLVRVRRRDRRFDITDEGAAVELAGRPGGWRPVVERLVATEGFNVNRRGVIFVPSVEDRDITALARRLGETSRATYQTLLEVSVTAS